MAIEGLDEGHSSLNGQQSTAAHHLLRPQRTRHAETVLMTCPIRRDDPWVTVVVGRDELRQVQRLRCRSRRCDDGADLVGQFRLVRGLVVPPENTAKKQNGDQQTDHKQNVQHTSFHRTLLGRRSFPSVGDPSHISFTSSISPSLPHQSC